VIKVFTMSTNHTDFCAVKSEVNADALVFDVLGEVHPNGELAEDEILSENIPSETVKGEAKHIFFRKLLLNIFNLLENDSPINDVTVWCGGKVFRLPSVLIASVSPVFKATAGLVSILLNFFLRYSMLWQKSWSVCR